MRRSTWLLALGLFLATVAAPPARALQLHWRSGADTLTFTEATRAVLILRADSAEVTLPQEWQLQWVGDSTEVQVVALDSLEVCAGDTAQVYGVDGPATPEDSTAHRVTAHFCSGGSSAADQATFQLDLPAWGRGRCRVVALDPTNSAIALVSNSVTFNGGVADEFAPAILGASSIHESSTLQVTVVGAGLGSVTSMRLTTPDTLWSVPLTITAQTALSITGAADVPTELPASVVDVADARGTSTSGALPADQIMALASDLPDTVLFRDPNWSATFDQSVYPKDFAFFYNNVPRSGGGWRGLFHLIYIRHNNNYDPARHPGQGFTADQPESLLAHAWSENLRDWQVDKRAFSPNFGNASAWDRLHAWGPCLLQVGTQVYMFYTGVDASHNQRIGYVTTGLLNTGDTQWSSARTQVYEASNTLWADAQGHDPRAPNQQQFRDPWVMPDPDQSGKYLLFNVGEDVNPLYNGTGHMIVGVARNQGSTLSSWQDQGAYRATDFGHTGITRAEAPLVMRDSTSGAPWRIFFANGDYDSVGSNSTYFASESLGVAVSDTLLRRWPGFDNLFTYLGDDHNLYGWEACEHVQVGPFHFFAGYNGDGIAITRTRWDGETFKISNPEAAVDGAPPAGSLRFSLLDFRPGVRMVRFGLESPGAVAPRLVIYDVFGRKIRTLLDGRAFVGKQEVQWDCRDAGGVAVPAGMYFARLTGAGPQQVRRVVVVR